MWKQYLDFVKQGREDLPRGHQLVGTHEEIVVATSDVPNETVMPHHHTIAVCSDNAKVGLAGP